MKTAIIVALERELQPLVQGWTRSELARGDAKLRSYQSGDVIVVAGGMGCQRSEKAARAVVEQFHPQMLVSAGLAGALIRSLKAGSVVTPNVVVDAATGDEYRCDARGEIIGGGMLVSAQEIAGQESKLALVERFHGLVVDMEAAGVARVALEHGIAFRCVKAISDELDFVMPPLNRFVDGQGNVSTGGFLAWAALRPHWWPGILSLARNSSRATRALCDWLKKNVVDEGRSVSVVTLEESTSAKTSGRTA